MIYITGDTHGGFSHIEEFCMDNETTKDDIIIILGDVGINYYSVEMDIKLKRQLSELPITLFCIHGNHEIRPENIPTYEESEYLGGLVSIEPDFPNLIFAKDGEIYDFDGNRCIVIGGAYSPDKHLRKKGEWWEDEQPSEWIKNQVEKRLQLEEWEVDMVLSHTCPFKYRPTETFTNDIPQRQIDTSTEEWLDTIEDRLNYSIWFCGHFHIEKDIGKMQFMYTSIMDLSEY